MDATVQVVEVVSPDASGDAWVKLSNGETVRTSVEIANDLEQLAAMLRRVYGWTLRSGRR